MVDVTWPNKHQRLAAQWYVECFRTAVRRVAALLNSELQSGLCWGIDLSQSDDEIDRLFATKKWDRRIVQFNVADEDPNTLDDEYRAEYFFYCNVDFPPRSGVRVAKFVVPKPFLDWGYTRLHPPVGTAGELEVERFGGSDKSQAFIRHCATNYLVKNFWHNFVHRAVQGITDESYHEFRGPAREDSDYEADNLANILLVRSYGYPVLTRGRIGATTSKRIEALFRRNRCNLMFAERAAHRRKERSTMSREAHWGELEWRFCRGLANMISMRSIAEGLAAPSLRVFLSGEIRSAVLKNATSVRTWRTGHVCVELSGRRINSRCPPYIPDDELRSELFDDVLTHERISQMRARRAKREQEIATRVLVDYRSLINLDQGLRDSVAHAMNAVALRLALFDGCPTARA